MSNVTEIRYVGYAVPDLETERSFYRDQWGLKEVHAADGLVYFAAQGHDEPYVVRLRQAQDKRIDVISFAADNRSDVEALHAKVVAAGCRIIFEPRVLEQFAGGFGFRFFSPDGLPFEISSDVERGVAHSVARGAAVPIHISHIVLHSPNLKEATAFFTDVLGFRLSDWIGDFMSFLRCNEWHHRIALLPGPPCVNHVAYDMPNLDEMMRGVAKLRRLDTECLWGPGRHTAGNNTFSYFVTPAGFGVEYTSELERVDESSWSPTVHEPKAEVVDQWGIGGGGPHKMPKPEPDKGLFQAASV